MRQRQGCHCLQPTSGRPHVSALTCRHKENPSTEDNVPLALVEAAGSNAHSAQQEQYGAEDGEDAGGSDHTCRRTTDGSTETTSGYSHSHHS